MFRYSSVVLSSLFVAVAMALSGSTAVMGAPANKTPIDTAYEQLGGSRSGLGDAAGREVCGLRDDGCRKTYEFGAIIWSPSTGAQPVWGAIRSAWEDSAAENGALGFPATSQSCVRGTCFQAFQRGNIFWEAKTGARLDLDVDDSTSVSAVVNKSRPLVPADYVPEDLVNINGQLLRQGAANAFARLSDAAAAEGAGMTLLSGYRSSATQERLYSGYKARYGEEIADAISARPGYSEHQTGLGVDIAALDGQCTLQACFGTTAAGIWVAENAHRFGFVIRYPADASAVTGYAYEPWHLRFVGSDIALGLRDSGSRTLEEYFSLPPAPGY